MTDQQELFPTTPFAFGPRFLHDHAGHIITDPRIAVVELVANSYDAGSSKVDIEWPTTGMAAFCVLDNGTGMSIEDFNTRWRTLSYSRPSEQGPYVEYPPGVRGSKRLAFGQNGKGRYSPFCFCDEYEVETWRDGTCILVRVSLTDGGDEPFHCELLSTDTRSGHGTCIRSEVRRNALPAESVAEAVGSKFIVDPNLSVAVNNQGLALQSLWGFATHSVSVGSLGTLTIHVIDALVQDRTTLLRGITWWVNGRMVGAPSWDGLDGRGAILDGRTAPAKRFSFVVEADFLKKDVRADWTGMHDTQRTLAAREAVLTFVGEALDKALGDSRRERKRAALAQSKATLSRLPGLSRRLVGSFIDEVQQKCPSLSQGDLARTASVFARMEVARSGYELLEKLAACSPEDLDTWNRLMEEWTASNAEVVLCELKRRLDLIDRLQKLVNVATTDELHELQPLFARGLWMFGPEYEAIDFTSNRAMATVISAFLGGTESATSSRRPDVVALPDRSVCCYSADSFDDAGEVSGVRKVLVVELKKGGFRLGTKELRQGEDYALELQKANLVTKATEIIVQVLGASLSADASEERTIGAVKIVPMTYETILKRAHARTFNLQRRLTETGTALLRDDDVEDVLGSPLFDLLAENDSHHAAMAGHYPVAEP